MLTGFLGGVWQSQHIYLHQLYYGEAVLVYAAAKISSMAFHHLLQFVYIIATSLEMGLANAVKNSGMVVIMWYIFMETILPTFNTYHIYVRHIMFSFERNLVFIAAVTSDWYI